MIIEEIIDELRLSSQYIYIYFFLVTYQFYIFAIIISKFITALFFFFLGKGPIIFFKIGSKLLVLHIPLMLSMSKIN